MTTYIVKRFFLMIFVILITSIVVFLIMHLVPGDSAEIVAKEIYGHEANKKTIEIVRKELGLNDPLYIQYFNWSSDVLHGDMGFSYRTGKPVVNEIISRLPATVQLTLASMLVSLVIAIPLGMIAALNQHSFIDSISMFSALFGVSMPNFWLGLLLIMFFSVNLGWLPVYGHGGVEHIILPSITLGTGLAAMTTRMMRSNMLEELGKDYIRTAQGKGLSRLGVSRHAVKNALIPVITIVGLQLASLIEGAVVVEVVFAWPGVGRLLVDSIFARDFPVIQGCVLFIAAIYALTNLLVDILYSYLDPRIHYGTSYE